MNYQLVYAAIVWSHIAAGAVALVLFWCAALSRKGSPFHKRCGRIYLMAMVTVIVTAVPLSIALFSRGQPVIGTFMAYLVVLVLFNCRNAWRAVIFKRDFARYTGAGLMVGAAAMMLSGIIVIVVGIQHSMPILIAFGAIGPITAWQSLQLIRRGPTRPNWWLHEHFGAMIGNGVATHIAFFQIGLLRAFPNLDLGVIQNLGWFGPLALGVVAGLWLTRRYAVKSPGAPAGSSAEKSAA